MYVAKIKKKYYHSLNLSQEFLKALTNISANLGTFISNVFREKRKFLDLHK